MAMVSWNLSPSPRPKLLQVTCRKRDKNRDNHDPYKVIKITPPPKNLGLPCFPSGSSGNCTGTFPKTILASKLIVSLRHANLHCGDSVTIEGQTYTISAVTCRYWLRKGKYEPSEKKLDVLSTARDVLNLYLENLLEQS